MAQVYDHLRRTFFTSYIVFRKILTE